MADALAALAIGVLTLSRVRAGDRRGGELPRAGRCPSLTAVRAVVLRELVDPPARIPGDIIARSEVKPVFDQLRLMGWSVLDEKAILKQVPGDTDFVLQRLRTSQGRRFMRKVARYPQAYDRLYRLATLPHGRQTVDRLIRSKGGDQFIAYLTESRGGKNLGKMLQASSARREVQSAHGKDLHGRRAGQEAQAELHGRATSQRDAADAT